LPPSEAVYSTDPDGDRVKLAGNTSVMMGTGPVVARSFLASKPMA
jgi:hypothetical protein